jgi:orotate phosphoribosyltransferase
LVDDVAVSGRKINRAIDLVNSFGGEVVGIGVLVDRSMGYLPLTVPLRSLLAYPMQTFTAKQCPLCAANIPFTKMEELN